MWGLLAILRHGNFSVAPSKGRQAAGPKSGLDLRPAPSPPLRPMMGASPAAQLGWRPSSCRRSGGHASPGSTRVALPGEGGGRRSGAERAEGGGAGGPEPGASLASCFPRPFPLERGGGSVEPEQGRKEPPPSVFPAGAPRAGFPGANGTRRWALEG